MKFIFNKKDHQGGKFYSRGFILPLTLLVCTIIVTISAGISIILVKELYFSRISRQSQLAYYAADSAMSCTVMVDDQYLDPNTGLGIFPYDNLVTMQSVLDKVNLERQSRNYYSLTLSDIKCATAKIFGDTFSSVPFTRINSANQVETGQKSTFAMRMDLGDSNNRCAAVIVYKTSTYRQIIARGFSSCSDVGGRSIERAIVNTTEVQ